MAIIKDKGGRPTKYKPEIIEEINQYLKEAVPENMDFPTVEGIAIKLGINKTTLYEWAKKHKKFSNALTEIKTRQKEALMKIGVFGGKEINQSIVSLLLKVNHDMIETTRREIGGIEDNKLQIEIVPEKKKKFKELKGSDV